MLVSTVQQHESAKHIHGFPGGAVVKNSLDNAGDGDVGNMDSIPGSKISVLFCFGHEACRILIPQPGV